LVLSKSLPFDRFTWVLHIPGQSIFRMNKELIYSVTAFLSMLFISFDRLFFSKIGNPETTFSHLFWLRIPEMALALHGKIGELHLIKLFKRESFSLAAISLVASVVVGLGLVVWPKLMLNCQNVLFQEDMSLVDLPPVVNEYILYGFILIPLTGYMSRKLIANGKYLIVFMIVTIDLMSRAVSLWILKESYFSCVIYCEIFVLLTYLYYDNSFRRRL
jgi:hypothetical protein